MNDMRKHIDTVSNNFPSEAFLQLVIKWVDMPPEVQKAIILNKLLKFSIPDEYKMGATKAYRAVILSQKSIRKLYKGGTIQIKPRRKLISMTQDYASAIEFANLMVDGGEINNNREVAIFAINNPKIWLNLYSLLPYLKDTDANDYIVAEKEILVHPEPVYTLSKKDFPYLPEPTYDDWY